MPNLGLLVLQGLFDFLKGLGAARLMAMIAVTAALIGFFAFVIMRVTTQQMTTLFTDLSLEDLIFAAHGLRRAQTNRRQTCGYSSLAH